MYVYVCIYVYVCVYVCGYSPGAKYFEWERKGVPLRLEIGPRDVKSNSVMMAKRLTGEKVCADAVHFTCSLGVVFIGGGTSVGFNFQYRQLTMFHL